MNSYFGNGLASSKDSPTSTNSNNFGVGLVFTSRDNLVEQNKIGGNVNGVYIDANSSTSNIIRGNLIMGNPPAQVSVSFGASIGADIQDMSAPGSNTFDDNRCLTYAGAGPSPCPSLGKPQDKQQDSTAFEDPRPEPQAKAATSRMEVLANTAIIQAPATKVGTDILGRRRAEAFLAGAMGLLFVSLAVLRRRQEPLGRN